MKTVSKISSLLEERNLWLFPLLFFSIAIQAQNINIGGDAKVGIVASGTGNTFNTTQVFGKSLEYAEIKNLLEKLDRHIKFKTEECAQMEKDNLPLKYRENCRAELIRSNLERDSVQRLEQRFREDVMRLAESFSKIPLHSERLRQAMALFAEGKIREAETVLRTEEMLREGEQLLTEKTRLEQKQQTIDSLLRIKADEFMLKAQLTAANYDHPFRYDSAEWYFQQSLRYKEYCQNLTWYGDFLQFHKKSYAAAIEQYEKGLALNDQAKGKEYCTICCATATQHNLGIAYEATGDFVRANAAYTKGLDNLRQWAQNDSTTLEAFANHLYRATYFYRRQKDYARAEAAYRKLIEASLKADKKIELQESLADMYLEQKDYVRAEVILREILEACVPLLKSAPRSYETISRRTQNKIILLYKEQQDPVHSKAAIQELLKVYTPLAKTTPQAYEPLLAEVQDKLGDFYRTQQDYDSAETAYRQALEFYLRLSQAGPPVYEPLLALIYSDMGILYVLRNDFTRAEIAYGEALCIAFMLPKTNPTKDVIGSLAQKNLKLLYRRCQDLIRIEASLRDSLERFTSLKHASEANEKRRLRTQLCLINLYEVWVEAQPFLKKAEIQQKIPPLYESLSQNYPDNVLIMNEWPLSLGRLAWYRLFIHDYVGAETLARAALQQAPAMSLLKSYLAHALLLQSKYKEAQKIYEELAQVAIDSDHSFRDTCLKDLDTLEKEGITHEDLPKARALLMK